MKINNLKYILIWSGIGFIITTFLYTYQKNSQILYTRQEVMEARRTDTILPRKKRTYYEFSGAITIGGALIILALGLKKEK